MITKMITGSKNQITDSILFFFMNNITDSIISNIFTSKKLIKKF